VQPILDFLEIKECKLREEQNKFLFIFSSEVQPILDFLEIKVCKPGAACLVSPSIG